MGKRDAFGNEIGEDNLGAMGWSLSGDATAAPDAPSPAAAAMPETVTPPPAARTPVFSSTPPHQLGGGGAVTPNIPGAARGGAIIVRIVAAVVAFGVIGSVVAGIIGSVDSVKDKVGDITDSFTVPSFTTPGAAPTPEQPATPSEPPEGLQPGSMLRGDTFAKALVKLRAQGSRAQTLRVDAESVIGNVLSSTGRMNVVSLRWNGDRNVVRTPARLTGTSAVSLKAVSSKSPSRAVARAAALLGRPARQVNYLVLTSFAGRAQWYVYFKDGRYLRASLDGRHVERIG